MIIKFNIITSYRSCANFKNHKGELCAWEGDQVGCVQGKTSDGKPDPRRKKISYYQWIPHLLLLQVCIEIEKFTLHIEICCNYLLLRGASFIFHEFSGE